MFCRRCGESLPEQGKYCPKCGALVENTVGAEKTVAARSDEKKMQPKKEKRKKKWFLLFVLFAVVLAAVILFGLPAASQVKYQRQISLGERYLDELDYEAAIAAFNKAIEISPRQQEPYLMLAQTYLDMGNLEEAMAVLQRAFNAQVDSEELQALEEEILQRIEENKLHDAEEEDSEQEPAEERIQENSEISVDEGAVSYNGHSYKVYTDEADTWEEALEFCNSMGGYMAVISSAEENTVLFQLMEAAGSENAYFGFTDREEEGYWSWCNEERITYTNWHSGEPNSENSGEDYAMFYYKYKDGTWNDGDFGRHTVGSGKTFICEWDAVGEKTIGVSELTYNYEKNEVMKEIYSLMREKRYQDLYEKDFSVIIKDYGFFANSNVEYYFPEEGSDGTGLGVFHLSDNGENAWGIYCGEFRDGIRAGIGTWFICDEETKYYALYEGTWKEDYPEGRGIYTRNWTRYTEENEINLSKEMLEGSFYKGKAEGNIMLTSILDDNEYHFQMEFRDGAIMEKEVPDEYYTYFNVQEGKRIGGVSEEMRNDNHPCYCYSYEQLEGDRMGLVIGVNAE